MIETCVAGSDVLAEPAVTIEKEVVRGEDVEVFVGEDEGVTELAKYVGATG